MMLVCVCVCGGGGRVSFNDVNFPSFYAGGVISLLALNGLFILMHEYHL